MSKVCPNSFAVAYNNKVYALFQVGDYAKIGVTGRPMQDRIKEHDRDFDSPVTRPPPFQSMPTTPDTSNSGTQ